MSSTQINKTEITESEEEEEEEEESVDSDEDVEDDEPKDKNEYPLAFLFSIRKDTDPKDGEDVTFFQLKNEEEIFASVRKCKKETSITFETPHLNTFYYGKHWKIVKMNGQDIFNAMIQCKLDKRSPRAYYIRFFKRLSTYFKQYLRSLLPLENSAFSFLSIDEISYIKTILLYRFDEIARMILEMIGIQRLFDFLFDFHLFFKKELNRRSLFPQLEGKKSISNANEKIYSFNGTDILKVLCVQGNPTFSSLGYGIFNLNILKLWDTDSNETRHVEITGVVPMYSKGQAHFDIHVNGTQIFRYAMKNYIGYQKSDRSQMCIHEDYRTKYGKEHFFPPGLIALLKIPIDLVNPYLWKFLVYYFGIPEIGIETLIGSNSQFTDLFFYVDASFFENLLNILTSKDKRSLHDVRFTFDTT